MDDSLRKNESHSTLAHAHASLDPVRSDNEFALFTRHLVNDPQPPLATRVNRQTVVRVGANVAPGSVLSHVQSGFLARAAALQLAGVRVVPNAGGNARNLADTVIASACPPQASSRLPQPTPQAGSGNRSTS